jgi:hypothetical protein
MKIPAGQKFFSTFFQPSFFVHCLALGTMAISAGIVAVPDAPAMITDLLMATKLSCPADRQGCHHFALVLIHGMGFSIVFTILPEDVGNLVLWSHCSPP